MVKYIFVTGGVVSGLGKGITAASLGMMLKAKGLKVVAQKLDPYLNIAPTRMDPIQHGEVFVTEDGAETDLDLGHYERFIDINLNTYSSLTSGKVYSNVLENDRKGLYHGETVQVIPHVTNEIQKFIKAVGQKADADVVISEVGGTTGDIESLPHIEALRQISKEVGRENCCFIHVTLAPVIGQNGEIKSKPTQHSVKELRSLGISPNVIVVRCKKPLDKATKENIARACSMQEDCVIDNLDVELLYEAPLMLEKNNFSAIVSRELGLDSVSPNLKEWEKMVSKARGRKSILTIGLVGQCVEQYDAYLSVSEALTHAGISHSVKIDLRWISGISLNSGNIKEKFKGLHGVIVPDGFGVKGSEGLVEAAKYARENKLPFFGIGLGMQSMAIAFTRQIIGFENVSTREFDHTCAQQLFEIPTLLGGSTRLGAHECALVKGTKIQKAYKKDFIRERHRHRLEFNNIYREPLKKEGMIFSAFSNNGQFVESIELDEKFFHLGVQFRPEFLSRPHKPHPLFLSFIEASIK